MSRWVLHPTWASPRIVIVGCITFLCLMLVYLSSYLPHSFEHFNIETDVLGSQVVQELMEIGKQYIQGQNPVPTSIGLVMAKTKVEDVTWVLEYCKEHKNIPFIYTTSTPPEPHLQVPHITRGREVGAYLSYIIDYYDRLPQYSIFIHATHDQWHNDLFGPETASLLPFLRLQSISAHGFINLRCTLDPGCPISVNPTTPTQTDIDKGDIRAYFAQAYQELFDVEYDDVPAHIGNICCGQFAVSRERIWMRAKSEYERMLDWAGGTNLTNDFGVGWVFEKIWPVVFGMEDTMCPRYEQCRCDNYGWCGPLATGEILTAVTSRSKS